MKKDDLIKKLLNASALEESHSQTVANFFLEDFDWSKIDQEKANKAKDLLKLIRSQTIEHQRILDDLVGKLKESEKNEF